MNALTSLHKNESKLYVRWSLNERIQHWALAIIFIVLVFTGFALRYPESWWVRPFTGLGWFSDFRGLVHRISGGIFVLLGIYHLVYLSASKRGKRLLIGFLPRMQDLRDMSQNISYNFGIRKHPPQFGHFSYMEKAEYLALIWGALIMGVTGLMLWFEDVTLALFPRWIIDLVTVIHLYEAWLASLAIVVWHFYYVIFNPDVYPLNTAMVDGMLTDKEFRHEYFREWQEMQEQLGNDQQTEESKSSKAF